MKTLLLIICWSITNQLKCQTLIITKRDSSTMMAKVLSHTRQELQMDNGSRLPLTEVAKVKLIDYEPNRDNVLIQRLQGEGVVIILPYGAQVIKLSNTGGHQQIYRKYDLSHTGVELKSGMKLEGELIDAKGDSMVLLVKNKLVIGSQVRIQLIHPRNYMVGTVVALTDTTIEIRSDNESSPLIAYWKNVVSIYNPPMLNQPAQRTCIKVSEINMIRVRKQGALVTGAVVGSIIGGVLGVIIGQALYSPPPPRAPVVFSSPPNSLPQAGFQAIAQIGPLDFSKEKATFEGALVGIVAGGAIGAGIGSNREKIKINGDQQSFEKLMARISMPR